MKLRCVFNALMRKHHLQGILLGQTTATRLEDYFGFHHSDVTKVHFHKRGIGSGIWFRLRCGRVIDEVGKAACRDLELYDRRAA